MATPRRPETSRDPETSWEGGQWAVAGASIAGGRISLGNIDRSQASS